MDSFDYYAKTFLETADRGFFQYKPGTKSTHDLFEKIFISKPGKVDRLTAAFNLIKQFLPINEATNKAIREFLQDPSALPFDVENFSFEGAVGAGSNCNVFLLQSKQDGAPSYVIKIQKNLEDNGHVKQAEEIKKEYEFIRDLYKEVPGVIPPESTLVLDNTNRFFKQPRVGLLQRFYGRDIKDFMKDVGMSELRTICLADKDFLETVRKFIDITLKIYEEQGIVVDLFGPKNLAIVNHEGRPHLILLDPHIIYREKDQESWIRVGADANLAYLATIQEGLKDL